MTTDVIIEQIAQVLKKEMWSTFEYIVNNQICFLDEGMMSAQRCYESIEWDELDDDFELEDEDNPAVVFNNIKRVVDSIMENRFPNVKYEVINVSDKGWHVAINN